MGTHCNIGWAIGTARIPQNSFQEELGAFCLLELEANGKKCNVFCLHLIEPVASRKSIRIIRTRLQAAYSYCHKPLVSLKDFNCTCAFFRSHKIALACNL